MKSILSDKTEIRRSETEGVGTFAREDIKKGEMIYIRSGTLMTKKEAFYYKTADGYWPITDDYVLAATNEDEFKLQKVYVNHSCDANCGIRGEITLVAMRDIKKGEEITQDYGLLDNEEYSFKCNCGSKNCRGIVTGFDWKIEELQKKYYDYFASYLKEKITK
ncbi:MAG TPA: SET domain-containing protein-lysine N-methyltransferase [Clostridiales bacterium]|nr:MAG: hypothetical protein A2Y22_01640 [Clostridiales bacterium GWD2_32_59]HAN09484.1 SET domain-containing protein-lysine N-methyltransferase [Clostridiales bacterium]